MELLKGIWGCYGGLPFFFELSLVIFFHELGHFLVARWRGVRVLTFSIGLGPELIGFTDRYDTRWKISVIPFGGYVKFFGDENAASMPDVTAAEAMTPEEKAVSFPFKPVGSRAAVVAAGPIANFLLALVIYTGLFAIVGREIVLPRVNDVVAGSAAESAGIKPGDLVVSIDGKSIESFTDMQRIVSVSAGRELQIIVDRNDQVKTLHATPRSERVSILGFSHDEGRLGIVHSNPDDVRVEHIGPLEAVWRAGNRIFDTVTETFAAIGGIITGHQSPSELGGPVTIARLSCAVAAQGFVKLLELAAFLSVSIGLLNLFPIPILDGGHLLFYAIEAVRGRPLSERMQEVGFRIGFAIIATLFVFVTYLDLQHWFHS
jgi:regulator of sigma E protease